MKIDIIWQGWSDWLSAFWGHLFRQLQSVYPKQMEGKSEQTIKRLASKAVLSRIGEPEVFVLFLVSDDSGWVTGQDIGVNGGFE